MIGRTGHASDPCACSLIGGTEHDQRPNLLAQVWIAIGHPISPPTAVGQRFVRVLSGVFQQESKQEPTQRVGDDVEPALGWDAGRTERLPNARQENLGRHLRGSLPRLGGPQDRQGKVPALLENASRAPPDLGAAVEAMHEHHCLPLFSRLSDAG